jgi:hypothetical protein
MNLKKTPLGFVVSLSFAICCVLTYILWVFERAYCAPWAPQYDTEEEIILRCALSNIDRSANIGDSFWSMMNMMTTLGRYCALVLILCTRTHTVHSYSYCVLVLILCTHTVHSYCTHTVYSYCTHTVLILHDEYDDDPRQVLCTRTHTVYSYSYCALVLILCTHTVLILHDEYDDDPRQVLCTRTHTVHSYSYCALVLYSYCVLILYSYCMMNMMTALGRYCVLVLILCTRTHTVHSYSYCTHTA